MQVPCLYGDIDCTFSGVKEESILKPILLRHEVN